MRGEGPKSICIAFIEPLSGHSRTRPLSAHRSPARFSCAPSAQAPSFTLLRRSPRYCTTSASYWEAHVMWNSSGLSAPGNLLGTVPGFHGNSLGRVPLWCPNGCQTRQGSQTDVGLLWVAQLPSPRGKGGCRPYCNKSLGRIYHAGQRRHKHASLDGLPRSPWMVCNLAQNKKKRHTGTVARLLRNPDLGAASATA